MGFKYAACTCVLEEATGQLQESLPSGRLWSWVRFLGTDKGINYQWIQFEVFIFFLW